MKRTINVLGCLVGSVVEALFRSLSTGMAFSREFPYRRFSQGFVLGLLLFCAVQSGAQSDSFALGSPAPAGATAAFPSMIKLTGSIQLASGQESAVLVGMTFSIYESDESQAPIWSEVQNVEVAPSGRYTVLLGSTSVEGIPPSLFIDKGARWLEVSAEGYPEQPRVLLLSVPYAIKAADADTLGGHPSSHFVTAADLSAQAQLALQRFTADAPPTVVPSGGALQVASRQYVDTQLAAVTGTNFHNVRYCDEFDGPNAGAKIAACIADLPSTGGTADARGFEGEQHITSTVTIDRSVTLLLGQATYTCLTGAAPCFTATDKRAIIIQGAGANEFDTPRKAAVSGTKFVWAGRGANAVFKFIGVENLEVSNIALDGANVASGIGIELLNSNGSVDTSSILLRRLSFSYFSGKGIKLSASGANSVDTSLIDDATLRSNGVGISFESVQAVGWTLRKLRFINNTTGIHALNGGGFRCVGCSYAGGTAVNLSLISDNITFDHNIWEMSSGQIAIYCNSPGGSLRAVVRVLGSRLDKSGRLGEALILWIGGANLYLEGNRIKDGRISLNNVTGGEAVHVAVNNWFEGTVANANWILNTPNGADVYNLYEYVTAQSTDIGNGIRPVTFQHRRVTSAGATTIWSLGNRWQQKDFAVFAANDATPSVLNGNLFKTANPSPTTITTFDDGERGQVIHVVFNDSNTTVSDAGTLRLNGALTPSFDDSITLVSDGTDWFELGRSSPSSVATASQAGVALTALFGFLLLAVPPLVELSRKWSRASAFRMRGSDADGRQLAGESSVTEPSTVSLDWSIMLRIEAPAEGGRPLPAPAGDGEAHWREHLPKYVRLQEKDGQLKAGTGEGRGTDDLGLEPGRSTWSARATRGF